METNHPLVFNYSDNWLCYAFFSSTKPGVAVDLTEVIGFGDYIDHSIITYEEINSSLEKLLQAEAIVRVEKSYCTTNRFNKLWAPKLDGQKKKSITKVLAELKEFLNTHFTTSIVTDVDTDMLLTKEEFQFAIDAYLKA
jgi:hypothetical protein